MDLMWIVAAAAVALLAGTVMRMRGRAAQAEEASRRGREKNLDTLVAWRPEATRILTTQELRAMGVLMRALPGHMVLAQVPLARFLRVPTRHSYTEWLQRVGQLCADLVVCDASSQVVAVVDVRPPIDKTSPGAQKRQRRIQRVLKGADIALHVWTENALPTPEEARAAILPQAEQDAASADAAPLREPPPSTWFDNLDSARVPLSPAPAAAAAAAPVAPR